MRVEGDLRIPVFRKTAKFVSTSGMFIPHIVGKKYCRKSFIDVSNLELEFVTFGSLNEFSIIGFILDGSKQMIEFKGERSAVKKIWKYNVQS
jgi:hypothetical protein